MTPCDPPHPLDPLLGPRAIALLGASPRPESAGLAMLEMARLDGYSGRVYPVNPAHREIGGAACYPGLESLPERADHVVLGVSNARLESGLDAAIAHGARAATIFASCRLEGDPDLAERIAGKARAAGMRLCGGNSMGFYNRSLGLRVAAFPSPASLTEGGIVWIAQSGSAFSALAHTDRRIGFALAVSSGMEMTTTVGDYMDWALRQPRTTVIGLFLEGIRAPDRFRAALELAAERGVPVVALKVGRTARSAAMATTHTGAVAGSDAAWRALARRYGLCMVDDLDEMAASLQLFDQPRRTAPGALAAIHDSGGERELLVDMAERLSVPFAPIAAETKSRISRHLEPGLLPDNPLDAWGTAPDYVARSAECLAALLEDPATALAIAFSDPRDGYWYSDGVVEAVRRAARRSAKPVALASNTALAANEELAMRLRADGIPLLSGTRPALIAARNLISHRDAGERSRTRDAAPPGPGPGAVRKWRARLATGGPLFEAEALDLLSDYGVPTARRAAANDLSGALAAAKRIGYPVALKTAEDHAHKTERRGVLLGLDGRDALAAAYEDLSERLGPRVLVQEMAPRGIEIALGAVDDPEFGPVVMVAAGGALVELIGDAAVALAPFGEDEAQALLDGLKAARLLEGWRGAPPADRGALARSIARVSRLAADLAGAYAQIDVNPVIIGPDGAVAVDALFTPHTA